MSFRNSSVRDQIDSNSNETINTDHLPSVWNMKLVVKSLEPSAGQSVQPRLIGTRRKRIQTCSWCIKRRGGGGAAGGGGHSESVKPSRCGERSCTSVSKK